MTTSKVENVWLNFFLDYYVHGRKNPTTINSPLSSWWLSVILPASQCSILPSSRHRTARRFGSGSSWPPGSPDCWTKRFVQPVPLYWFLNVLYLAFKRFLSPEYHLLQHGRGSQGCAFLQRTQSRWIFQICKMNVFLKILFVLSILTLGWKLNFFVHLSEKDFTLDLAQQKRLPPKREGGLPSFQSLPLLEFCWVGLKRTFWLWTHVWTISFYRVLFLFLTLPKS